MNEPQWVLETYARLEKAYGFAAAQAFLREVRPLLEYKKIIMDADALCTCCAVYEASGSAVR
jgi:hypothetical protein